MNNKIIISSLIVIVLVVGGVLVYSIIHKKAPMDSNNMTSQGVTGDQSNQAQQPDTTQAPNPTDTVVKPALKELGITDAIVGTGAEAKAGDEVTVHYTGKLSNDVVFDSSFLRNQPFVFKLGVGMVIEGWDKGVQGMKVGGKRMLAIPSEMAYGQMGQGSIPPGSDLYFEVDLLSIKGK